MAMAWLKIVTVVAVTLWALITHGTLALPVGSTFRCQRSSPELNTCVREGLTRVFQYLKSGSMELGVPPLEPLEVPMLEMKSEEESNLSLDLIMRNIRISGLSDIVFVKVTTNLDDVNKIEVTGKTPALKIIGEYTTEGLIVNFPLHSAGTFSVNMTEVTSSWVVYLRDLTKANTKYLKIDGFDVDMMPINISFRPAAQLDGDNHLGEAVDIILNENSHEIYSIIKKRISAVLSDLLTELANTVLTRVPERLYLEP